MVYCYCWQCEHLPGLKFFRGSYKCNCKEGYEYQFNDRAWYFDGQQMEEEYRKMIVGDLNSRYIIELVYIVSVCCCNLFLCTLQVTNFLYGVSIGLSLLPRDAL